MILADSYYDILQISRTASTEDIKRSFRALALKYHPDKNKNIDSKEKFLKIVEAYEILSDSNSRKKYDITITEQKDETTFYNHWTPPADFRKYYSYQTIKNWSNSNNDFKGGLWDIGEKENAGMWKTTLMLFACLGSIAVFILLFSR